ncbi:MAG: hypothetical protein FIB04_04755 [Gammaproteobacteria bacterium]|nr:hypothetical protein [Gammaproteobacteria bacterium]
MLDWMWVVLFPVARVPSWQVMQVAVTPSWLNLAGFQAFVVWQLLHAPSVGMWFADLPVAAVPSWQEEQVPSTCV